MALADRIIGVESGGNANARNPRSSATGAGQFIASTWEAMLAKHRPDLVQGRSREEILALRNDPELSRAMTDAYASDNSAILTGKGLPVTPGTQYLAHFAGPQGAVGILSADPAAPAGSILGGAVVKANPFLAGMSAGDLAAWADRKMGGAMPGIGTGAAAPFALAGSPAGMPAAPAGDGLPIPTAQSPLTQFLASLAQPKSEPDELGAPPLALAPRPQVNLRRRQASLRG